MPERATRIAPTHLRRGAYVYVRQSSPTQVRQHTESLERQYELADRAQALGWAASQVVVIDGDLGRSGSDASAREGFQSLVADVGLGRVGIILGIEVSRLARNNADWYRLLDLCAVTDTLIADGDGCYHPGEFNDRLVLGLKGTMSECELHLIRQRMTEGLRHKAAKGELRQGLPVGFCYDDDDRIAVDPDEAVRAAIATVFQRFDELGTARQVMLTLRDDGLLIPRRQVGSPRVSWAPAAYPAIHDFLTNPTYAGAFVFGRRREEKRLDAGGRLVAHTRQLPRAEWEVLIVEHHPGYISWEKFEANQDRLRTNWRPPRGHGGGAVREGTALLQGLIRCGRCGRMMQTAYSGAKGDCPRYVCARAAQLYGTEHGCQSLGGRRLEARVLEEVFAMLEPAALAATARALAEAETVAAQRIQAFELAVERSRYQAERARRSFEAVEPENRLVARSLESAWEAALVELRRAEADLAAQRTRRPATLSAEELQWLSRAGADVRAIFAAGTTTARERKQLLRAVIAEVVVTVRKPDRQGDVRIVWEGGAATEAVMALNHPGGHARATPEDTVELVRKLAGSYNDATIAVILGRQHRRTGSGLAFTRGRVQTLRAAHGIPVFRPAAPEPPEPGVVVVGLSQAEQILGVSKVTIYRWLRDGFITGTQVVPGGPWHIRIDEAMRAKVVGRAPAGWVRLDEAARALGVARQTVLDRIARGELSAVHVNRGGRKGLAIELPMASGQGVLGSEG